MGQIIKFYEDRVNGEGFAELKGMYMGNDGEMDFINLTLNFNNKSGVLETRFERGVGVRHALKVEKVNYLNDISVRDLIRWERENFKRKMREAVKEL